MKWLVASEGDGRNDFAFTERGETVVPCMAHCDSPACGCTRAFAGLKTRKATTLAEVVDLDTTAEALARQNLQSYYGDEPPSERLMATLVANAQREIDLWATFVERLPIGTLLRVQDGTLIVVGFHAPH